MRIDLQIERRNNHRNYIGYDSDQPEEIEQLTGVRNEPTQLKYAARELFDNHSDFYDHLGFDAGKEHGPTGENFNAGGFITFCQDAFGVDYLSYIEDEDHLQQICDAFASKMAEVIDEEYEEDEEQHVARSQIKLDTQQTGELKDPELLDEALLVGRDNVHKVQVQQVEDADSIDDIEQTIRNEVKGTYETQVDARVGTLKNRIQNLEEKIEEEKTEMLIEGIKFAGELDDWEVDTDKNRLVYQKTVHPTKVAEYKGDTLYTLTEEAREKFYIKKLSIPIKKKVTKIYFEGDAYHPHAFDYGACSGSFSYTFREAVENAVEQMQQINLHAGNQNDAEREMRDNLDEYTVDEEEETEVWETW